VYDVKKTLKPDAKATPEEISAANQTALFEKAAALFHQRDFAKARPLFEQAAVGPLVEIAHAARMHQRMCDRRLASEEVVLKTPDEHYNYAISLVNRGNPRDAVDLLRKAVAAKPDAGHYHYALALASGLTGDMGAAAEHLRRAIEIEPGNRVAARNDPDFHVLGQDPRLREILSG
jgi:tetratricopeptide (TPR) repeat protein